MLIKREGLTTASSVLTAAVTSVYDGALNNYCTLPTAIHDFAGTELATGLTSSTDPDWATFNAIDLFCNGTEVQKTSNGTTFASLGGTPPAGKYIAVYNQMVFLAGHDATSLRWTDTATYETWPATNSFTLGSTEDPITGLAVFKDTLIVFCKYSFYHLRGYGNLEMQISNRVPDEGSLSHRSICVTPYGLFWWSRNGLTFSPDGFSVQYPMLAKHPALIDAVNRSQDALIHCVWNPIEDRVEGWCFTGSSSTCNQKFFFYPKLDSLWLASGAAANMGASGLATVSGVTNVYAGSAAASGYLYKVEGNTDSGVPITSYLETKQDTSEYGPTAIKKATSLMVRFLAASGEYYITYAVYLNNRTSPTYSWQLPFVTPGNVFMLDSSVLDGPDILGSEFSSYNHEVFLNQRWTQIKHRIYDASVYRTRIRGIVNKGRLVKL